MPGTVEFGLPMQFTSGLRAILGLAGETRLANPEFKLPFCIVMGELDYVKSLDDGASEALIYLKK